ncbi:MAG: hypothetical protein R6X18_11685 [Chloroflexota bacterium]
MTQDRRFIVDVEAINNIDAIGAEETGWRSLVALLPAVSTRFR